MSTSLNEKRVAHLLAVTAGLRVVVVAVGLLVLGSILIKPLRAEAGKGSIKPLRTDTP